MYRKAAATASATMNRLDRLGMLISGACILHCLLVPVVLSLLPLWPLGEAVHKWLHPVFALILLPTTFLAARSGYRRHRQKLVVFLLSLGLCIILIASILGHQMPGAVAETALTLLGSTALIAGHWRNWVAGRRCAVPSRAEEPEH